MGACIYCGEPAGFLHKAHPDCKTKHELALRALPEYFKIYIESDVSIEETKALVEERGKDLSKTTKFTRLQRNVSPLSQNPD
jgi:hypothetical protein